jgi:hypothetical protein
MRLRKCLMCDNVVRKSGTHKLFCSEVCYVKFQQVIRESKSEQVFENPDKITLEFIKSLRRSGRGLEAQKFLNAWREQGKKHKAELKKEIRRKDRLMAMQKGLCGYCLKRYAVEGLKSCEFCYERNKIYRRTSKERTRLKRNENSQ